MCLKETNPAEFEQYVQMAADAAKLAEEKPTEFAALMADAGAVGGNGTSGKGIENDRYDRRLRSCLCIKHMAGIVGCVSHLESLPRKGGENDVDKVVCRQDLEPSHCCCWRLQYASVCMSQTGAVVSLEASTGYLALHSSWYRLHLTGHECMGLLLALHSSRVYVCGLVLQRERL